jgi:hypothetical protein
MVSPRASALIASRRPGIKLDVPLTERLWGPRDVIVTVPGEGPKVAFRERTG